MKHCLTFCLLVAVTGTVSAAIDVTPSDTTVTPGVWCGNFPAAKTYAEQHNLPLVLFWGNNGCDHCEALSDALSASAALAWAKGQDAVFCFVEGTNGSDTSPNAGAKSFAKSDATLSGGTIDGYPYVRFWYPGVASVSFTGRSGCMYSTTGSSLASQFENSFAAFLSKCEELKTHSYATFPFGTTLNDRLEGIPGETDAIEFPVTRTNALEEATSCVLEFSCNGTTSVSNLTFAAAEGEAFVRYPLPAAFSTDHPVTVTLKETTGAVLATRTVTAVAEGENSPKNPCFIGERTADGLAWGEWTMDLDVATQKVAAASGSSTLVLVGGSLWCPDCYSTDEYLIDTPEFKNWAKNRQIACVAIDVTNPHSETANTSLLTWDSTRTGDRYVTCNYGQPTNELLRYESGAGYLSRHGVTAAEASAVAARNKWLLNHSTEVGGLCRPDDLASDNDRTGPFKTGIPCLIAMRPDGTIAGRIYQFNNVSASNTVALAGHLARLGELFDQQSDVSEEANDSVLTTPGELTTSASVSRTLSAVDTCDILHVAADSFVNCTVTLKGAAKGEVTLRLTDESGEYSKTLAETKGILSDGLTLKAKTTSGRCFVRVGYPQTGAGYAEDGYFGFTNTASTVAAYTLSLAGTPSGGEIGFVRKSQSVDEDCAGAASRQVMVEVARQNGTSGSASVKVSLATEVTGTSAGRFSWTDTTVNWANGESGVKSVPLTIFDDEAPMPNLNFSFVLTDLTASAADTAIAEGSDCLALTLYDDDVFGELVYRQVAYSNVTALVNWQEGDSVSVKKTDGSLPSGLSIKICNGEVIISGTPTRAGEYDVSYAVSIWRNGVLVGTQAVDFACTVRDVAFSTVISSLDHARTYSELPVSTGNELVGTLTLTVPTGGRLSAKYRRGGQTFAYAARGWQSFDEVNGLIRSVLTRTTDASDAMEVELRTAGGQVSFADPASGEAVTVSLPASFWSASHPADAWKGQYTVQMPQTNITDGAGTRLTGDAYLALRLVSASALENGRMLYAGVLPNGQTFSGTASLLERDGAAEMTLSRSRTTGIAPYVLAGVLRIRANAADTYKTDRWSVQADSTVRWTVDDACGHNGLLAVYGGYYDSTELLTVFQSDYDALASFFAFSAGTAQLDTTLSGTGASWTSVALTMTETGPVLTEESNPRNLKLTFSPVTGVVSGSFRVPFANATECAVTYRGIALPGWQSCEACGKTPVQRPWASGAFSFSDRTETDAVVRVGAGIELDCKEE